MKRSLSPANFKIKSKSASVGKKRSWNQVTKKIRFEPSAEDLDKSNILRPSDHFLRLLMSILSNKAITLEINLPQVLIQDTGDYLQTLITEKDFSDPAHLIGKVNFRSGVTLDGMMQQVEVSNHRFLELLRGNQQLHRFYSNRIFNEVGYPSIPYLIYKEVDTEEKSIIKLQTYQGYRRLKKRVDGTRMIRRFVYPRGSSIAIHRYCYRPRRPEMAQTFLLKNLRSIQNPNNEAKRTTIKPKDIWLLNLDVEDSFSIFQVKNERTSIAAQCNHLVDFLQKVLHIRIDLIVTDWIQDTNQITWFAKLQYIKYEPIAIPDRIEVQSFACSVCCRLCGQRFRKQQAQRTVTYKLIQQFLLHLKQRGRKCSLSISSCMIQSCKVCDLCYMLILSEYELINAEKEFNSACGIPLGDLLKRVSISNTPKTRPSQVPLMLHQWRLFFYLNQLIGLQPYPDIDLTLSLRIHNRTSYFRIGCISQPNFKVNRIRIHYLFSEQPCLSKFQSQTQVFLRLIHTKDKSHSVAQGSFSSLQFTKPQVQRRSQQVLLFYQNAQYCEMELKIGLVCDGIYDTSTLNLFEQCGAYTTDQNYTNANCMPDEWMEIFDMDYSGKRASDVTTQLQETNVHRIMDDKLRKGSAVE